MSHPHAALLDEYEIAIKKLPPTLPDLAKEAQETLKAMRADESLTEAAIFHEIGTLGRQEYAHRHAIQDLHKKHGGGVSAEAVLEHVDESVRKKIAPLLESGVELAELTASELFQEQLSAEERYQVEDGILVQQYKAAEEDAKFVAEHKAEFDKRVEAWEKTAEGLDTKLASLEALASEDEQYKDEILAAVEVFRQGWSVVERDPDPVEIDAAIDYWRGVLGMDEEQAA